MKKKNNKLLAVALGAAAVGIYRAAKGKGAFNKLRFSAQHDAISKYIDSHHPGAAYSAVESVGEGWSCVIYDEGEKYLLYLTCSPDGIYIFEENKI